ncbi:hypothetical protein CPC08DRAFT_714324 [Agrocybe pediades]|nr:hypothetical protein CPC08DRAFT_714324 [Agrocybe pediades]
MAKWAHMEVVGGAGTVDELDASPITSSRPQPFDLKLNPQRYRRGQLNCNRLHRLRYPWPLRLRRIANSMSPGFISAAIARRIPTVTFSISSITFPSSPAMTSMVTHTPTAALTMGSAIEVLLRGQKPPPAPRPLRSFPNLDIPSILSHAGVKHDARRMLRSQRLHGNGPAHR